MVIGSLWEPSPLKIPFAFRPAVNCEFAFEDEAEERRQLC
jgi:hypothetical protein